MVGGGVVVVVVGGGVVVMVVGGGMVVMGWGMRGVEGEGEEGR